MRCCATLIALPLFGFALGCARAQPAPYAAAALDPIDSLLVSSIADRSFPAAAMAIGTRSATLKSAGYGSFTYDDPRPVNDATRFDLASLTKVVATTTSIMLLHERGAFDLDDPVSRYVPEFGANGKGAVTIRNLLQHRGGLIPFRRYYLDGSLGREEVLAAVLSDSLVYEPGTDERYSDLGFITLGALVERLSGQDLAAFAEENIFRPLGMGDTGFRRGNEPDPLAVPTEIDTTFRGRLVHGVVHDENAFVLGGVAGHAGLFSSARDLSVFARMMLGFGEVDGVRILDSTTVALFVDRRNFEPGQRGLGWDFRSLEGYSSAGTRFGPRSFGHTGFTGTSLWLDPDAGVFAILLTNRVYPSRENRAHIAVRPAFADLAYSLARATSR